MNPMNNEQQWNEDTNLWLDEDGPYLDVLGLQDEEIGSWRLEKVLGLGGLAVVYRAWHNYLDRPAAIKMLRPEYADNDSSLERFQREAHAIAQCNHPNIVKVIDFGADPEFGFYLVMELLEGVSLSERWKEGLLPHSELMDVFQQICDGLTEVHRAGLIHRDLKPSNILLVPTPEGQQIKLIDFGTARTLELDLGITTPGTVLGTPSYMAPEQLKTHGNVSPATDVYALGVLLFEALTGGVPIEASTPMEHMAHLIEDQPPSLGERRPELAGTALERLLQSTLATEMSQRPSSVKEFWEALEPALQESSNLLGETWSEGEESVKEPEWSPQPRLRLQWLWLTVLSLVVLGSLGFGLRSYFHSPQQPQTQTKPKQQQSLAHIEIQSSKTFQQQRLNVPKPIVRTKRPNQVVAKQRTIPTKPSALAKRRRLRKRTRLRRSYRPRKRSALSKGHRYYRQRRWKQALQQYVVYLKKNPRSKQRKRLQVRMKSCRCALSRPHPWEICKKSDFPHNYRR